jgi:hypothetical protein
MNLPQLAQRVRTDRDQQIFEEIRQAKEEGANLSEAANAMFEQTVGFKAKTGPDLKFGQAKMQADALAADRRRQQQNVDRGFSYGVSKERAEGIDKYQRRFIDKTKKIDESLASVSVLAQLASSYDPVIAGQIDSQFIAKMIQGGQLSNLDVKSSGFNDIKSIPAQFDQFWRNQAQLGRNPEFQKSFIEFVNKLENALLASKRRNAESVAREYIPYIQKVDPSGPRDLPSAMNELQFGPFNKGFDEQEIFEQSEEDRLNRGIPRESLGMGGTLKAGVSNALGSLGVPKALRPSNPIEESLAKEKQQTSAQVEQIRSLGVEKARKMLGAAIKAKPRQRFELNKLFREAFPDEAKNAGGK